MYFDAFSLVCAAYVLAVFSYYTGRDWPWGGVKALWQSVLGLVYMTALAAIFVMFTFPLWYWLLLR